MMAKTQALTYVDLETLVALKRHIARVGVSPTLQELADQFGTHKVTMYERLTTLERKGRTYRTAASVARNWRPVFGACPYCGAKSRRRYVGK